MKTSHKISVMQTLLAVLCGVVLAVHRAMEDSAGKAMFLVGLAAALVILLSAVQAEGLRKKLQLKPLEADKFGFALLALAGLLFLVAGGLFFLLRNSTSLLHIITCVFSVFCGMVTLARLSQRDGGKTAAVFALVPIFFLSFFLLVFYRSNGDNPYLRQFGYEVAVILVALLGTYAAVSGRFEKARPRFRAFGCGLGMCFIAQELLFLILETETVLGTPGFSLGAAVMLAAYGVLLCYGLFYPPAQDIFPETGEKEESEETEETGE